MYSNIQFIMEGDSPPCTVLAAPIRIRLFREDLDWLEEMGLEPAKFIQSLVNIHIKKIRDDPACITGEHKNNAAIGLMNIS